MGEMVEMVMEGVLCECCGVFVGDEESDPPGHPLRCEDCEEE